MEFNKDELVPPPWMNQDFFQGALRNAFIDSSLKVSSIDIKPGSKPGEHFASIMFRVAIEYQTSKGESERLQTIVKVMPYGDAIKKDVLSERQFFDTEIRMYKEVLPKMEQLLRQIGDETKLAPRMIYGALRPNPILIFEDISPLGFVTPNLMLPFEDAKKIAEILARFHATSMVLNEEGLDLGSKFDKYVYDMELAESKPDNFAKFIKDAMKPVAEAVRGWKGYERFAEKLEARSNQLLQDGVKIFRSKDIIYKVLIHGDFHFRNFMVKFKNGTEGAGIEDLFLVDYQCCYWTTPGHDIAYLIQAISDIDVKLNHGPELIVYYFEHFASILKKLNYKGRHPTLLDLNLEVLKTSYVSEIMLATCFLPMFFLDFSKDQAINLENLVGDSDKSALTKHALANKDFADFYKKYLTKWSNLGYLD